jgi:hypothetical protein
MTEATQAPAAESAPDTPPALPTYRQLVNGSNSAAEVRAHISAMLRDDATFHKIVPFFSNGILSGHKAVDAVDAVDRLIELDGGDTSFLKRSGMPRYQIAQRLLSILRQRYDVSKEWKVVGVRQLQHTPAPAAPAAPAA